jgi:hypothetical protein
MATLAASQALRARIAAKAWPLSMPNGVTIAPT